MIPKIGDKVIFDDEWLDQLRVECGAGARIFCQLRGQILSVKSVGPGYVCFDETSVIIWINADGTAYNSGSGKLSKMFPLRLYGSHSINKDIADPDICKKCGGLGKKILMCCKCTNCGEIIWGI